MFTGIIEHLGRIDRLERAPGGEGGRLVIRAPEIAPSVAVAGSIAVNGCCLTVVEKGGDWFAADLSGETLRRTSFSDPAVRHGAVVNLERPLTAGKEFGGHFVQGHVDGVGRIARLSPEGQNWWLAVRVPEELSRYVAMKGSLAVDGVSLTVAAWSYGIAEFAIIPYTYAQTNLRELAAGDPVNLECDILAKYVERLLEGRREVPASRLTLARLVEEGF